MKKSIKVLALVICLAMCAAFTACDKQPADSGSEASQNVSTSVSAAQSNLPTVSDMITDNTGSEAVSENGDTNPYSEVLANYKNAVNSIADGTFDLDTALDNFPYISESESYKWVNMFRELSDAYKESVIEPGYALYDIDKDGTNELFLINKNHDISAMFTISEGNVKFLDAYWARYYATLCEDNTVFTHGAGGADNFEDVLYKLSDGKLVEILSFGCEKGNYYKVTDGEHSDITPEEYRTQTNSYKICNDVLEFIAI